MATTSGTNIKLKEITTQYHSFVDDQVLTSSQLNNFINYFEDQDRMSRVFLQGVGIVCGFELTQISSDSLTISQGVGVTTDGDLITLRQDIETKAEKKIDVSEFDFKYWREFEDKNADYSFFIKGSDKIKLIELLTEESENSKSLTELQDWQKMVALFYLEAYVKEADLCAGIDCNNQGEEQTAKLRVLLITENDMEHIVKNDTIFLKHDIKEFVEELPELAVRRVILNPNNSNNHSELALAYRTAINSDNLINNLIEGVKLLFRYFSNLLKLKPLEGQFVNLENKLKKILFFSPGKLPSDFQYRYDLLKDLVDTWNEIRALLLTLNQECFPDMKAFPKHLLLGNISDRTKNRHQFYQSPAVSSDTSPINRCRSLIERFFILIENYQIKTGDIKITPSNRLSELGNRAVPFYMNVDERLLQVWDFEKAFFGSADTNLSYHRNNLSQLLHIQEPLNYNTNRFDFYRIEGHQGKNYKEALDKILDLKEQYGLAFDVKALSLNINEDNIDLEDYDCVFEDLELLLKIWKDEQECVLAEVSHLFSGFSFKEPGKNLSVADGMKRSADIKNANYTNIKKADNQTVYTKMKQPLSYALMQDNIVLDNIVTTEYTIGSVVKEMFTDKKYTSVEDMNAIVKDRVERVIEKSVWEGKEELKEVAVTQPILILSFAQILAQRLPTGLAAINKESVNNYQITLEELCKEVDKLKTRYQNLKGSTLSPELSAMINLLINQLSGICCSGKKLKTIHEEISKRKEKIVSGLKFSEFANKHKGLEHKAGVEPGGTFVLVYLNQQPALPSISGNESTRQDKINISDLNISNIISQPYLTATAADTLNRIKELENYSQLIKKEYQPTDEIKAIDNLLTLEKKRLLDRIRDRKPQDFISSNSPNFTVIADFSLPYLCCSDCAAVNFVIQKPPVSLLLQKDKICLGQENEIRYEVSPHDGEIKTDPEINGIVINQNKIIIDSEIFPEELFGKPISFTVNQQITDTQLTVYQAPNAEFEWEQSTDNLNTFIFTPKNVKQGETYFWDFGDGNTSSEEKPIHEYKLVANDNLEVLVKLTVFSENGICTATVEHEIMLESVNVEIQLGGDNFCVSDENGMPFTTIPENINVVIEGKGVVRDGVNQYRFVPALAGVGEHRFTVNAKDSQLSVVVHNSPSSRFEVRQERNLLTLTNRSTGANRFTWIVNNDKYSRSDLSPIIIELNPNSSRLWNIELIAENKYCGTDSSKQTFQIEPIGDCISETKESIFQDLEKLKALNIPRSNYVVPIWMSTSEIYGGTSEFNNGVLDNLQNFLSGSQNGSLKNLFLELIKKTSGLILSATRLISKEEISALNQLLELQLKLLYNILGCQEIGALNKYREIIAEMFKQIITIFNQFSEAGIRFPRTFIEFMDNWRKKVDGKDQLVRHAEEVLRIIS